MKSPSATESHTTEIAGLDEILKGGLPSQRLYLLKGVKQGQRTLYITLSETQDKVNSVAQSHGWNMEGIAASVSMPVVSLVESGHMSLMQVDPVELADMVMLLRDFEQRGCIRKAISVVKKRMGRHEDTIRELKPDRTGIRVGEPLENFEGVLTGVPTFHGQTSEMSSENEIFIRSKS